MKIYIVTEGEYSNYSIITATVDKAIAESIAKKFNGEYSETRVEEFENAEIMLKNCWYVYYDQKGAVIKCTDSSHDPMAYKLLNWCHEDNLGGIPIYVLADNSEDAIKIASEKRAQFLAEKAGIT